MTLNQTPQAWPLPCSRPDPLGVPCTRAANVGENVGRTQFSLLLG